VTCESGAKRSPSAAQSACTARPGVAADTAPNAVRVGVQALLDTLAVLRATAPAATPELREPLVALLPGVAAAAGHGRAVVRAAAARTAAALAAALPDAVVPALLRWVLAGMLVGTGP